jgi:murein DD-endopeptidase MepM/ murein hydrolase activator NlpD
VAYTVARHRKPERLAQPADPLPQHRKSRQRRSAIRSSTLRVSSLVVILLVAAAATVAIIIHLPGRSVSARGLPTAVVEAGAVMSDPKVSNLLKKLHTANPAKAQSAAPVSTAPAAGGSGQQPAAPAGYLNPLRAVTGLIAQRIDMGVDFVGTGPVYAIGDAIITNAQGDNGGWPGGGWITYQLTDGPAAGLMVYVAEEVIPTVQVGDHVTASTVIGTMNGDSEGIETGWAMPDGASAESQLAVAGGVGGNGPFPTEVGVSFDTLLVALGVPVAPNVGQPAYGVLPPGYPTEWPQLTP